MIREILKENVTEVTFTKANGETRVMTCTLNESLMPAYEFKGGAPKTGVIAVYDLENDGWRSFREDSVISYRVMEND